MKILYFAKEKKRKDEFFLLMLALISISSTEKYNGIKYTHRPKYNNQI
jgi:hypothetical protein